MNRIYTLSVCLSLGLLQAACGSSKTTATSEASPTCTLISDQKIAELFPAQAINPNILQLYTALGSSADATFAKVTDSIVQKSLAASTADLGDSFQAKLATAPVARQQEFTADLKAFLASAFGGPAYPASAPQMEVAHSGLAITVAQYNAFISKVVVPALVENGVSQDTIGEMAPVVMHPDFVKTVVSCE